MSLFFILDKDKNIIPANILEWGNWIEENDRVVKKDFIDDVEVSTVFLGLDHPGAGKLNIFETMIFNKDKEDIYCERYDTWQESLKGHEKAIELLKENRKNLI